MSHYFQTPNGKENRREIKARFWDTDWSFTTADGVFSANRLDLGTSILLRESPPPSEATRLLDLGCGYGAIAIALACACPQAQVDAVDTNERALALCATNAASHRVGERVHPMLPEQVPPQAVYDEIWSNPPIRIGKPALHALLLHWLARLKPEGMARLVVGKNLGADSLQAWLGDSGYRCERVASAKGFRVLTARPETAGRSPIVLPEP